MNIPSNLNTNPSNPSNMSNYSRDGTTSANSDQQNHVTWKNQNKDHLSSRAQKNRARGGRGRDKINYNHHRY